MIAISALPTKPKTTSAKPAMTIFRRRLFFDIKVPFKKYRTLSTKGIVSACRSNLAASAAFDRDRRRRGAKDRDDLSRRAAIGAAHRVANFAIRPGAGLRSRARWRLPWTPHQAR